LRERYQHGRRIAASRDQHVLEAVLDRGCGGAADETEQ
jgi:hypothetical protein